MENKTNIFERIEIIAHKNGYNSINKFSKDGLGYKSSEKINRLKDPTKKPSFDIIEDIINNFPVDAKWLITGEEEIKEQSIASEPKFIYSSKTDTNLDSQKIPLYDAEAVAGIVPVFEDFNAQTPVDYLQIPNSPKCDGAMYATGDSMYPIVKSGDILGYKEIKDLQNDIFWGQIYILYIEVAGDVLKTVKYIHKGIDQDHIKLVSENRHHEPKEIHLKKIKAIAQVKITVRLN